MFNLKVTVAGPSFQRPHQLSTKAACKTKKSAFFLASSIVQLPVPYFTHIHCILSEDNMLDMKSFHASRTLRMGDLFLKHPAIS